PPPPIFLMIRQPLIFKVFDFVGMVIFFIIDLSYTVLFLTAAAFMGYLGVFAKNPGRCKKKTPGAGYALRAKNVKKKTQNFFAFFFFCTISVW
ncbi:hypothetical protein ACVGXP_02175, partial [Enterobacter hormaechei]